MARRTTFITLDRADELEQAIGDYLSGDTDNGGREIRNVLRMVEFPKPLQETLFNLLNSLEEDIDYLADEVTRGNIEAVADGCKRLDEWLGKRFHVHNPRSRRQYRWMVWS